MRILCGVGSHTLPCGCLVGRYLTYDDRIVSIVDARGDRCADAGHYVRRVLTKFRVAAPTAGALPSSPSPPTSL